MQDAINQLTSSPTVTAAATVLGVAVAVLWVLAAWWTYQDMGRRTRSELAALAAAGWILLSTPLLLVLALPIYLLARPQQTVAQRRGRDLALAMREELAAVPRCPACGDLVEDEWRRCPSCATWLAVECDRCGKWSSTWTEICPWCGTDRPAIGSEDPRRLPRAATVGERWAGAASALLRPRPVAAGIDSGGPSSAGERRDEPARRRQVPARLL